MAKRCHLFDNREEVIEACKTYANTQRTDCFSPTWCYFIRGKFLDATIIRTEQEKEYGMHEDYLVWCTALNQVIEPYEPLCEPEDFNLILLEVM